jgi:plastocyanin
MFRSRFLAAVLTLYAFSLSMTVGCNKPKEPEDVELPMRGASNTGGSGNTGGPAASKGEVLKAELKSTIKGRVVLDGKAPEMEYIEQIKASQDKSCCWDSAPDRDRRVQKWMVEDGGVENVIIFLEPPPGKSFADLKLKGVVEIDQPFCQYEPHVSVVRPGEIVKFKNSAVVNHNVTYSGTKNPSANFPLAPKVGEKDIVLKPEKKPLEISCASHKWMSGYVWPTDTPYAVVSKKTGTFEIKDVPTGVELAVKYWHESNPKFVQHGTIKTKEGDNIIEIKIKPN